MRVQGVYVPLLTPMKADGRVDTGAVAGHVERMLVAGVDGFVALGTTGEFADLLPEERAGMVEATLTAVGGRVPVLVGVGAVGTAEACAHARRAEDAGADGVLSLPPLYWKLDDAGVLRHYSAVCRATGLPVLLYDFPGLSGTPLTAPLVERIAAALPGVVGIKQSGPELRVTHDVLRRIKPARPEFSVLSGAADLMLPGLLAGIDGVIAAVGNIDPAPLVGMLAAVRAGALDTAASHHRQVVALQSVATLASPGILALKAAAGAFGSPLEPAVRTWPDDVETVVSRATALAQSLGARV